jgi:hypothetical protein
MASPTCLAGAANTARLSKTTLLHRHLFLSWCEPAWQRVRTSHCSFEEDLIVLGEVGPDSCEHLGNQSYARGGLA